MTHIITFLFFCFGIIIGSFLNVVIYRLNTKKTLGGRSACMSCRTQLRFYELVPIVSFLMLRGRCKSCKTRISRQYPLVEAVAGLVSALLFLKFQAVFYVAPAVFVGTFVYFAFNFFLLLVVSVYDIRHKIIPDELSLLFGVMAFLGLFVFNKYGFNPHLPSILEFTSGIWVALPFALLFFLSRGAWMGFGDVKLALGLGWLLGVSRGFDAVVLACWIGAIIGVSLMFGKTKYNLKSELPFAPFLVIGAFLVFVFGLNIFHL